MKNYSIYYANIKDKSRLLNIFNSLNLVVSTSSYDETSGIICITCDAATADHINSIL